MDAEIEAIIRELGESRATRNWRPVAAKVDALRPDEDRLVELAIGILAACAGRPDDPWMPQMFDALTLGALHRVAASAREHLGVHADCRHAALVLEQLTWRDPEDEPLPVLHVMYPDTVIEQWRTLHGPHWVQHPTWSRPPDAAGIAAVVGGQADEPCPRCGGPAESLLTLTAEGSSLLRSRDRVQFAWCASCTPYTTATFGLVDSAGRCSVVEPRPMIDIPPVFDAYEPFPHTDVLLMDLGREWRRQPWDSAQNLHRVGGEPVWVQYDQTPACLRCSNPTAYVAQIEVSNFYRLGEGTAYLFWCDPCAVTAAVYQQS